MRFPLEVFDAVRAAFPAERPVTCRVSGTDWVEGGWDIEQTVAFAKALEARGCSGVHVSSGGLSPAQQIAIGPGYQVPLARAVKQAVKIPVIAVGLITDYDQAEAILKDRRRRPDRHRQGGALRSALALARGRASGRQRHGASQYLALAAARIPQPVRRAAEDPGGAGEPTGADAGKGIATSSN